MKGFLLLGDGDRFAVTELNAALELCERWGCGDEDKKGERCQPQHDCERGAGRLLWCRAGLDFASIRGIGDRMERTEMRMRLLRLFVTSRRNYFIAPIIDSLGTNKVAVCYYISVLFQL